MLSLLVSFWVAVKFRMKNSTNITVKAMKVELGESQPCFQLKVWSFKYFGKTKITNIEEIDINLSHPFNLSKFSKCFTFPVYLPTIQEKLAKGHFKSAQKFVEKIAPPMKKCEFQIFINPWISEVSGVGWGILSYKDFA